MKAGVKDCSPQEMSDRRLREEANSLTALRETGCINGFV